MVMPHMTKYPKVLWVSDIPRYLGLLRQEELMGNFLPTWLTRVTFALSYEDATKALGEQEFDLHILNGNFPMTTLSENEVEIKLYLDSQGQYDLPRLPRSQDLVRGNFINLYRNQIQGRNGETIVFTGDIFNLMKGRLEALPFFLKTATNRDSALDRVYDECGESEFYGHVEFTETDQDAIRRIRPVAMRDVKRESIEIIAIDSVISEVEEEKRIFGGIRDMYDLYLKV